MIEFTVIAPNRTYSIAFSEYREASAGEEYAVFGFEVQGLPTDEEYNFKTSQPYTWYDAFVHQNTTPHYTLQSAYIAAMNIVFDQSQVREG